MHVTPTAIPDVLIIEPKVFGDARGFFFESWNARAFAAAGIDASFVQDNHSRSHRGVLRGLHYQIEHAQGKLVRVVEGEVFDVAVDLRAIVADFRAQRRRRAVGRKSPDAVHPTRIRARFPRRCPIRPNFSTRRPITGIRSTSGRSCGTTLRSASTGRKALCQRLRRRTPPGAPLASADCYR